MSQATLPAAPNLVKPEAVRVLLFGMPAAGKTSLLGALNQAAQTQEHLLAGRLYDLSHGLAELQGRLYEERGRPTGEEIVPHPVIFEPTKAKPLDALLIDCDGRVANDLLQHRKKLSDSGPEGSLANAVLSADTLVLLIDASATPTQVEADFAEFGRFLHFLEKERGLRTDIGGLPVFLVLTKCDLLARPQDTLADWVERIEERKHQVHDLFRDFLARTSKNGPVPFGRIDLHLWATAVKRPPLAGSPARPREPYGVAELFRQCLAQAQIFHQRRQRSVRLLWWTLSGVAGLIAVMLGLILVLLMGWSAGSQHPLQSKLPHHEARAAVRLAGPMERLQRHVSDLTALREDPLFASLPEEEQSHVESLLKELRAYIPLLVETERLPQPADAQTEKDLDDLEILLAQVAIPPEYEHEWTETDALQEREIRLADLRALRQALTAMDDERSPLAWYLKLLQDGRELQRTTPTTTAPASWSAWLEHVKVLLARSATPSYQDSAPLAGARTLTYSSLWNFRKLSVAKNDWEVIQKPRLERLRDLSLALGLAGPAADGRPQPLDIPRPPLFAIAEATARLQRLAELYPGFAERLTPTDLPLEATAGLRAAAQSRYENLLEAARPLVLEHLKQGGGEETLERWRGLLPWLENPPELKDWRVLARLVGRLSNADLADPVTALADFVKRDTFALDFSRLTLEIPDSVRVRPVGQLEIHHPATSPQAPAVRFNLVGEPERDEKRGVTSYQYVADEKRRLTYRPGETLWAVVAARDADRRELELTWANGRTAVYQFERLQREPFLHRKGQPSRKEDLAAGVLLRFPAEPRLPDLLAGKGG